MFANTSLALLLIWFSIHYCLEFVAENDEDKSLQVEVDTGKIQGIRGTTENDTEYIAYRQIPYAAPPVGELRFMAPEPALKWTGVLNASVDGQQCFQFYSLFEYGAEDCLFINVYVPQKTDDESLKVMVWIHGGAFVTGTSEYNYYGPDYLLDLDVIIVTFNYRVGIFGFLSTRDMHAPGNYGLKDQVAALRWVSANIAKFGGDPDEVTIFGESAGAASVSYMLLAPQAKGLFKGAISQSGSALCPWAFNRHPKRLAFIVGMSVGVLTFSSRKLVAGLRKVSATKLLAMSTVKLLMCAAMPLNGLAFSPTIEPDHPGAIITKGAHELLRTGQYNQVPYIIGFNSQESSFLHYYMRLLRPFLSQYDVAPSLLIPLDMNANVLSVDYLALTSKIRSHYFGFKPITILQEQKVFEFISDTQFNKPEVETARLMSQHSPVYFYQFSYSSNAGYSRSIGSPGTNETTNRLELGVGHTEEMWYLWKKEGVQFNDKDLRLMKFFQNLWINFAKDGNPTPEGSSGTSNVTWPPWDHDKQYLNIALESMVEKEPKKNSVDFWNELYETYGNPPYTTY